MSSSASCLMIVPNISVIEIDYHAQQFSFMVICIACGYLHTQIDFYVNLCNKCMSTAFVCLSHHEGRLLFIGSTIAPKYLALGSCMYMGVR